MKRSQLNFLVDAVAFVMFVFMVVTGVTMEFLLPAGSGHSTTLWGLDRHGWGDLHFWLSVVFLTALAVHVYLHWRWIVSVLRGRPREGSGVRVGLGAVGLLALLAIAVAPLLTPVERGGSSRTIALPRWDLSAEAEALMGSTTLDQVLETTGVSLDYLILQLGLPTDVSLDDRLGQLARENGFSVADVRDVVERGRAVGNFESNREVAAPSGSADDPDGERQETAGNTEDMVGTEDRAEEHDDRQAGLSEIRGSMTLGDVVALGVPREALYREMRLPAGTPLSERLGRLARTYGFALQQVRDLVDSYR